MNIQTSDVTRIKLQPEKLNNDMFLIFCFFVWFIKKDSIMFLLFFFLIVSRGVP
jgi:hypothetical protein